MVDPGQDATARAEAMDVAESAREATRSKPSFAAELFLGNLQAALLHPYPEQDPADRQAAEEILKEIATVTQAELDPDAVDDEGEIPAQALEKLHAAGAFRLKLPTEYGGLGFSQLNYNRAVALVSSWCGSTAILLSGHQSIGVTTPLKFVGTEAQKRAYLPRLAGGELSAFALTEPEAGSDPARLTTRAEPDPDGDGWILNGEKLWCTNGPVADILIVMARTPDKVVNGRSRQQISAFIVETSWPGFESTQRCEFLGYGGIQSGHFTMTDVRVPKDNLLWGEGKGLKLALMTLNTGRLTLPATNTAAAKQCLHIVRRWAGTREQWGGPIGTQEAIAVQVGWIAAHTFAMEAFNDYAAALADRGGTDIRLEAAMSKLFCSETLWAVVDRTLQIRGGRGYETARSLRVRGETPYPVSRIWREARLNRIIEGTSEIMRLFLAREALDPFLRRAGALARPGSTKLQKLGAVLKAAPWFGFWYVRRWLPILGVPSGIPAGLRTHWRYLQRGTRRLARRIFHAMVRHGASLEHRQGLLGRIVDEGLDLMAMGLAVSRAASRGDPASAELADLFCRHARTRIAAAHSTPASLDRHAASVSAGVLQGRYRDLEQGIIPCVPEPEAS